MWLSLDLFSYTRLNYLQVMVTNVTSLLKTVKAVEDEHTRGTRALESTIEAIAQEIRVSLHTDTNSSSIQFPTLFPLLTFFLNFFSGSQLTGASQISCYSRRSCALHQTNHSCHCQSRCGWKFVQTGRHHNSS